MVYRVLTGLVRVGYKYLPEFRDEAPCFCWEDVNGQGSCNEPNLNRMITSLRRLRVYPNQIDNMGTENPFITEKLSDERYDKLIHGLSRQIVLIIELQRNSSRKFIVDCGILSHRYKLREIPAVLNYLGCKEDDLLFRRKEGTGYGEMKEEYKWDILANLE